MLRRQLYRVYILALCIPILIIGSFLVYNNYTMLFENHEDMLTSDNLRIRSVIYEATTSITNICDTISENSDIKKLLSNEYSSESKAREVLESNSLLADFYQRQTEISSIILYTDNKTLISYEHIQVITKAQEKWFYKHIEEPGYNWSTLNAKNQFDDPFEEIQLIHPIKLTNSDYEVLLIISISNNYLKNRIDNNHLKVDVTVNDDPIFFSTWGMSNEVIEFDNYCKDEFYSFSGITQYLDEVSLLEVSTIKPIKSDDSVYIFSKDPIAISRIRRILLINIILVCMSVLVPLIVIIKFTNQLSKRVTTLRTEMHRVTSGDYDIIETFNGNDELVDLFKDLQTMIKSIVKRDQEIYESNIKAQQLINHQQKTELELLSSKINPHFLYNTLETIRMKAFNSDNYEVAQAVKMLGKYMRYNLESTGELTTIESELSYIEIYLNIQRIRFKDRISYSIHVDKSLQVDQITILPLLMQPIVENACIHAHEETLENGLIKIMIKDLGQHVSIEISDNGIGIEPNKLKSLIEDISKTKNKNRTSIGLYNINQRLKLYYGEEYGLEISSQLNKGSHFKFKIPKVL